MALVASAALVCGCGGSGSSGIGSGGATTGPETSSSTGAGGGSSSTAANGSSSHSHSASASTGANPAGGAGGGMGGGPPFCTDGDMPLHMNCNDPHYALGESYACDPGSDHARLDLFVGPVAFICFSRCLGRVYRFCATYPIPNAVDKPTLFLQSYNLSDTDRAGASRPSAGPSLMAEPDIEPEPDVDGRATPGPSLARGDEPARQMDDRIRRGLRDAGLPRDRRHHQQVIAARRVRRRCRGSARRQGRRRTGRDR